MTRFAAVAWKEVRELLWFLAAGVLFFSGVPLVVALYVGRDLGMAPALVLWFGGATAVFVAVGVVSRDFSDGLRVFWQSRPIPVLWALSVKWIAGWLVVLTVTCAPLAVLVAMGLPDSRPILAMLACHTFVLLAIYAAAFLLSCLLRQGAQAAVLSLAAGLLLYFAPALFPQLNFMDVFHVMAGAELTGGWLGDYSAFGGGYVACAAGAATLAGVAVARDWRLRLGRKTIAWLLAGVALLSLGANAFQLGSNLELERRISVLPKGPEGAREIARVEAADGRGLLLLYTRPDWRLGTPQVFSLRSFQVSGADVALGHEVVLPEAGHVPSVAWSAGHPDRAYVLLARYKKEGEYLPSTHELLTVSLDPVPSNPILHTIPLEPADALYLHGRLLYWLTGPNVGTASVADPDAPALGPVLPGFLSLPAWQTLFWPEAGQPLPADLSEEVLDLPSLAQRDRLEVSLALLAEAWGLRFADMDGDLLVMMRGVGLGVYRLTGFRGDRAEFELIGHRQPTPLERAAYGHNLYVGDVATQDGVVYVWNRWRQRVAAYDVSDPEHPRRTGHFVLAKDRAMGVAPLEEGRLLIAGRHDLYIVRLPRRD